MVVTRLGRLAAPVKVRRLAVVIMSVTVVIVTAPRDRVAAGRPSGGAAAVLMVPAAAEGGVQQQHGERGGRSESVRHEGTPDKGQSDRAE